MRLIKNLIFLFLLLFLSSTVFTPTAFASDKPVWTIDYKKLNLPEGRPVSISKYDKTDPGFYVDFTPDNRILVSFLQYSTQTELVTKDTSKKFNFFFVVLLLSRENGELIRRVEWPVGELTIGQRIIYGSRIYPLPSGGYVGIIDRHLQALDSSFNVIYSRVLDALESGMYEITVPLSDKYFSLNRRYYMFESVSEIIDSSTFEIVERFDAPDFRIVDIWENQLLAITKSENGNVTIIKGEIGGDWTILIQDLSTKHGEGARYVDTKFIYNGTIVVSGDNGEPLNRKGFWFTIEDGKRGDLVFPGIGPFKPSRKTPIIATKESHKSWFRRMFDLFAKNSIKAYDVSTRQALLATPKYTDIEDFAISPDGDGILLMRKKKMEFYSVNSKEDKKK